MSKISTDFLIIGGGIIGLTLAHAIKEKNNNAKITIIEKEKNLALHGSGRNSGVLHAGFYYTTDSLKAKFCRDGNLLMRQYIEENNLPISYTKKLVVAQNAEELKGIFELKKRGDANNVETEILGDDEIKKIEPNAKTYEKALFSPNTATTDPKIICEHLKNHLIKNNVEILSDEPYLENQKNNIIKTKNYQISAGKIINSAGLYADKIARDFGFSDNYTIIPFKGVYLKYHDENPPLKTNIYPVPNLKNPFLGVHFTITANQEVKIGPTAIPAFWRENYQGFENFKANELAEILRFESELFFKNSFGFRNLAFEEMKKYKKSHLLNLAKNLVQNLNLDEEHLWKWSTPGIRAQLLNKKTLSLVQDFIVEGDTNSTHILNAISPAFTSSFAFSRWVVEKYITNH